MKRNKIRAVVFNFLEPTRILLGKASCPGLWKINLVTWSMYPMSIYTPASIAGCYNDGWVALFGHWRWHIYSFGNEVADSHDFPDRRVPFPFHNFVSALLCHSSSFAPVLTELIIRWWQWFLRVFDVGILDSAIRPPSLGSAYPGKMRVKRPSRILRSS